ncbi:secreted RxLR effector protein 161-like [Humulus lupulus]|uniref:secreted RxLR effector protein 161-like n=1 Tax=Humulus lupulus TaxID=3486 RepID=UPI002B4183FD|nr:secreted RxLR effector protein 161-like [Humulus lupulus]
MMQRLKNIPLASHFKLSYEQCPKDEDTRSEMDKIPYAMAVGCLMYIMVSTRPDIAHSLSILSCFMSNPGMEHWNALKWLLRYLKGTAKFGLVYQRSNGALTLNGYVDADFASNNDIEDLQQAICVLLNKSCICWKSQLQQVVALSTTEVEFMATTEAFKEAIWLQGILQELKLLREKGTIFSDSQSLIHLCKNLVYHDKSKHIDIRLYWIREKIEDKILELDKVPTEENLADLGTKVLSFSKLAHCRDLLNIAAA